MRCSLPAAISEKPAEPNWALANSKIDERELLASMLYREPRLATDRPGLLVIAGKGFASTEFENDLVRRGAELLRPSFKGEKRRKGESLLKSVWQLRSTTP
ncbi:hypothetical protein MQE23_43070 [Streptomyces sp. HP-A2021]|uniref:hypothetical protein n=1 Tax=Streptomyces sp. HP-A2021 TaxID=2927875 RepID=UPI001FAF504B|nr:hypothetical protein [Streptomyces sp. HP-A2021]UOB15400.1 hypothetical protein MQE23_43070 [Streptomyces sp. HP-A2021]